MTSHTAMMQQIEAWGGRVVPGFGTVFCFKGREAAMKVCRETSTIVTFFMHGQKILMVPCVDGCFELPFQTKEQVFTAYDVLDEFGYLAYGGTKGKENASEE